MADNLDSKSRELLRSQRLPEHVERKQVGADPDKAKDKEKPDSLKDPDNVPLNQPSHFTQITNESKKVQDFAAALDVQISKRLNKYSVETKKTNELLDAEERLFGTRTGVITYGMYRTCLSIIGKQATDFASKVSVTPDMIKDLLGNDPVKMIQEEGASAFKKALDGLDVDLDSFSPIEQPNMDDMQQDWIIQLVIMMLDYIDPTTAISESLKAAGILKE